MMKNRFPTGWNEKKVQEVIDHYENQTEEEALAEDESAFDDPSRTMMEIPKELVPIVRELIARYEIAITKVESLARKERIIRKKISKI
jgi:CHASE3 domain sensor protein